MAEERNARRANKAARTRARNAEMRWPSVRRSNREVEDERANRGRRTLREAFLGVPSRGEFLARADAFEMTEKKTGVLRAFISPSGVLEGEGLTLYWYRRDGTVDAPTRGVAVRVVTTDGRELEVVPTESATEAGSTGRLEGKRRIRTCTGVVTANVFKTS